jgi:hypothetical protein
MDGDLVEKLLIQDPESTYVKGKKEIRKKQKKDNSFVIINIFIRFKRQKPGGKVDENIQYKH